MLLLLRWFMQTRSKGCYDRQLRPWLVAHNLFLSGLSLLMVIGVVKNALKVFSEHDLYTTYCGIPADPEMDVGLGFWAYVFYASKYYELIDTFFLVLRKSDLTFLHVFHHSTVVVCCWYALHEEMVFGWITCLNNASVHVLMYYYYAQQARNVRDIWWKKYLTSLQILQFTVDCVTSVFFIYFKMMGYYCRGTVPAWFVGNGMGIVFFFLFADFYRSTYKGRQPVPSKSKKDLVDKKTQ